jgi:hypothetical protein
MLAGRYRTGRGTDQVRSELLGHSPFSGNLVESTGRSDLGGDHVERSRGVECLDVLLRPSVREPDRYERLTS